MYLKSNLKDYLGITHDDKVKAMLEEASKFDFTILPSIDEGKKCYSVFKRLNKDEEETYMIYTDNWISGYASVAEDGHIIIKK